LESKWRILQTVPAEMQPLKVILRFEDSKGSQQSLWAIHQPQNLRLRLWASSYSFTHNSVPFSLTPNFQCPLVQGTGQNPKRYGLVLRELTAALIRIQEKASQVRNPRPAANREQIPSVRSVS
jgi:hypothetical protein